MRLILLAALLTACACHAPHPTPQPHTPPPPDMAPDAPPTALIGADGWPKDDPMCATFGCEDRRGCLDITEGWPDIKPCREPRWRAYATPDPRCVRTAPRACSPATCASAADCLGEELCLIEAPDAPGRCAQVTCAQLLAAYTQISSAQSAPCSRDEDCARFDPASGCCDEYAIHVMDGDEAHHISALYDALGCVAQRAAQCAGASCDRPRAPACDAATNRCKLVPTAP
jgi:hypothetical protein